MSTIFEGCVQATTISYRIDFPIVWSTKIPAKKKKHVKKLNEIVKFRNILDKIK